MEVLFSATSAPSLPWPFLVVFIECQRNVRHSFIHKRKWTMSTFAIRLLKRNNCIEIVQGKDSVVQINVYITEFVVALFPFAYYARHIPS